MNPLEQEEIEVVPDPLTTEQPEESDHLPRRQIPRTLGSSQYFAQGISKHFMREEEVEEHLDTFCQQDKGRLKSWSRRLVERLLQHYEWYFPGRQKLEMGTEDAPSLEKAWAYYEHFALARYLVGADGKPLPGKPRAEPGEVKPTMLYNPWNTAESNLNEWGIGVGLYFATLRAVAIILLVAGLINIPSILHYASPEYSGEGGQDDLFFSLIGSAVCTKEKWVVCTTCNASQWDSVEEQKHYGTALTEGGEEVVLVTKNDCNLDILTQGFLNLGSLVFLIVAVGLLNWYQMKRETLFDIGKQTASDYSVVVRNPPPDAFDPELWRDFFTPYAQKQVTAVVIVLNNEQLLRKLITRRVFRNQLRWHLPKGVDMDNEDEVRVAIDQVTREREGERGCFGALLGCTIMPILHIFNLFLPPHTLVDKIFKITEEIEELQKEKYDVIEVFVTFETEAGQRNALSAFDTSKMNLWGNRTHAVSPDTVFGTRGDERVLLVEEPEEPSTIRWLELDTSLIRKSIQRLITFSLTCGMVVGSGFIVAAVRNDVGPELSAPLITIFNFIFPILIKLLMLMESHQSEGSWQESLYLKITLFRWFNTAMLTQIITPFTQTVTGKKRDILPAINSLLWSELWLAPFLRVFDIMGNIRKHILGPRKPTQETMNLSFQGTPYFLGERYTDFTKVMFLIFYYCPIFPGVFFFGFAILVVQYYVDKFCLLRIWTTGPFIGSELARISRRYFFTLALLFMAIISSYTWAQFPYDNLCEPSERRSGFAQTYRDVVLGNGLPAEEPIEVERDDNVEFCSQYWADIRGFPFPPTPERLQRGLKWMTKEQETLTRIYGWTMVGLLIFFIVFVFGGSTFRFFKSYVSGVYTPDGEDQNIDFSSEDINAYAIQFKLRAFPFPFLACDVDDYEKTLIGWSDPLVPSFDKHNLMYDVPWEGRKRASCVVLEPTQFAGSKINQRARPIFGIAKSWSPFEKKDQ